MPVILGGNTGIYLASLTPSVDPDAQAFITAAAITDPTQQAAINTLVVDLKGYNIWTKMKAIYPMVGGTSTSTSYNLKNPAQFQISWQGGVTWNANGVQFGGVNGYGITGLTPSTNLTLNNGSLSFYSRTNGNSLGVEIGTRITGSDVSLGIYGTTPLSGSINTFIDSAQLTVTDTLGFYQITRTGGSTQKVFKNTSSNLKTISATTPALTQPIYLGCLNNNGAAAFYSNRQCAFATIGDGLTDTEAANFYTAVQAFQTTLGRSIGTQTVSDADAQAFVTAANIVDQVEANAINNLVIGMKADGTWSKMKAVYPMVGGSSSTMKFNLKNPLDTNAAFRLQFNGGWTFSSTGALPNGTNAFADSFVNVGTHLALNSTHVSVYSRTNVDRLAPSIGNTAGAAPDEVSMWLKTGNASVLRVNSNQSMQPTNLDSRGLFIGNRANATQITLSTRGTQTTTANNSISLSTTSIKLSGLSSFFDNKEIAFSSIGDGLTNTDMTNLTTRIDNFQLALNRNI